MATVLTPTTTPAPPPPGSAPRRRWRAARTTLTRPAGVALGVSVLWFSLLVLIPLALVVISAAEGGWETFRSTLTNVQTANAIRLTLFSALAATGVNMVVGTLIAWVLVRDRFPGKRVIELVIDIPFALPSLVAGLVLLSLYGPNSPMGLTIAGTPYSVFLAVLFVTLPFVVRTVEPVLLELDPQVEQAARSLGASRAETFRRIVLPTLTPAIAAGATLSFARGVGEFGALVLFTGNRPNISEGAPIRIQSYIEIDNVAAAATVAVVLLAVALLAIAILDVISRRVARHG
ncbi:MULTISPECIES: ABC transporter permease [unclassified Dietzia]|uniref:ABC transporter permease n=1 Tax=unclassified Dietzia TaxID=2617939 RepID=UPI0015F84142|nr:MULTISPECIES: ABC transporter permease subunit [unclassified Dietzia]MBB1023912.1 ABC transporter permease subunit [Dietzia sp. DQ12-76]MBB1026118.1 ABC transporter permease subunit [Dietzia sp. DQ11-38-2]